MTEELKQKAENYIIDRYKFNECYREDTEETREYMRVDVHSQYEEEYQLYLAGLLEGQPKWHDLRKDPNDLPKKNKSYWVYMDCQGNKVYRSIVWQGCWCGWNGVALAWCEEPQFKE